MVLRKKGTLAIKLNLTHRQNLYILMRNLTYWYHQILAISTVSLGHNMSKTPWVLFIMSWELCVFHTAGDNSKIEGYQFVVHPGS